MYFTRASVWPLFSSKLSGSFLYALTVAVRCAELSIGRKAGASVAPIMVAAEVSAVSRPFVAK